MGAEHDAAVADARAHLEAKGNDARPLGELPASFASTRVALHAVAERLLKAKRELETGKEIALGFAPEGFGTIPWDRGVAGGGSGSVRVEGTELVLVEDGEERRAPADDLQGGAELLHVPMTEGGSGPVDAAGAAALTDWFAFGTVVLADLLDRHPDPGADPIRLWPEHFDVATTLGDEEAGRRANVGASPGDDDHPEPYLYVGPWDSSVTGPLWNATGFPGAELPYRELAGEPDQLAAAAAFIDSRLAALGPGV